MACLKQEQGGLVRQAMKNERYAQETAARRAKFGTIFKDVPGYWKNKDVASSACCNEVTGFMRDKLARLLRQTGGAAFQNLMMVRAERVENMPLWRTFGVKRAAIAHALCRQAGAGGAGSGVGGGAATAVDVAPHELLDQATNEVYLWHGTSDEAAAMIAVHGFDERIARMGGLSGAGSYFAENAAKSLGYARPNNRGELDALLPGGSW